MGNRYGCYLRRNAVLEGGEHLLCGASRASYLMNSTFTEGKVLKSRNGSWCDSVKLSEHFAEKDFSSLQHNALQQSKEAVVTWELCLPS